MNIVVNQIIAVLQVLTFRNTVSSNQKINLCFIIRHKQVLVLGYRREASQYRIQITSQFRNGSAALYRTRYHRCIESEILLYIFAYIIKQILSRISKSGKDNDFLIILIDWVLQFILDNPEQLLKFRIILRCNISNHQCQKFKNIPIFYKTISPGFIIHISNFNFDFLSKGKQLITVLILTVKFVNIRDIRQFKLH